MPRPRMSDEERKAATKAKNQRYYQKNKEKWLKDPKYQCCVYVLTGLPDEKVYVGVSKRPGFRYREHKQTFGVDIVFNSTIAFDIELSTSELNIFESMVIDFYGGKERCLNKYTQMRWGIQAIQPKIERFIQHIDVVGKNFLRDYFTKVPEYSTLLPLIDSE